MAFRAKFRLRASFHFRAKFGRHCGPRRDMPDSQRSVLAKLTEAVDDGRPVALATVVETSRSVPRHAGSKMLIYQDGNQFGSIGGGEMEGRVLAAAAEALVDGQSRLLEYRLVDPASGDPGVCGGDVTIFVEPYVSSPTVYVIGCGHIGKAVVDLAGWLGYRVVATDDRTDLATPELLPEADVVIAGPITEALQQAPVTDQTHIVLVTRNAQVDLEILPHLLATPARTIGVMGSHRRWETTKKNLESGGVASADLDRVVTPIGIEIGAETPEEIALSVMAQVVSWRRGIPG